MAEGAASDMTRAGSVQSLSTATTHAMGAGMAGGLDEALAPLAATFLSGRFGVDGRPGLTTMIYSSVSEGFNVITVNFGNLS